MALNASEKTRLRRQFMLMQTTKNRRPSWLSKRKQRFYDFCLYSYHDAKIFLKHSIPWENDLQEIACKYGNITRSYFLFVRWLTVLNFLVGAFLIVTLVNPTRKSMTVTSTEAVNNDTTIWERLFPPSIKTVCF